MNCPLDKNTRFSVIGMGRSGVAAANFLNSAGFDVLISDGKEESCLEKSISMLNAGISVVAGRNEVRRGDVAVISPGIPPHSQVFRYALQNASELIGEIELFYRFCPAPIIAVTGTDGKSTVTTLTGHILRNAGLKTHVGGNLGNPLTGMLGGIMRDSVVVAEVSCFQLITTRSFRPKIGVVTNIAEDHTDYHGSFENYVAAKKMTLRNMAEGDCFVKNIDDAEISGWHAPAGVSTIEISSERRLSEGVSRGGDDIVITRNGRMKKIIG
ncbi:MAG: UDP-N-acetylmuramoyl-L-alanine--D-glutamate ligase, partial [Deltaproteobacteria bacterium]|nr:UDP-N-acetylmuramoyl-L-alanine--D-glutamate ligase [Deltaproteobacteria bacterium]